MPLRVGIIGTGWIGRGLALLSQNLLIHEPEKLMEKSDIIIVSTGDPVYSTEIIDIAFRYNLPVVTMDADTLVLTGSWLSKRGQITSQPGTYQKENRTWPDPHF